METKIELFTKFKALFKGEEGEKKINITKELENSFHKFMLKKIQDIIDWDEAEFIEEFMEYSDCYFEGFDSIKDYGKFEISLESTDKTDLSSEGKKQ